jgi:hypothetical protein
MRQRKAGAAVGAASALMLRDARDFHAFFL